MHGTNPYPGYRPFEPNESAAFFGRESEAGELLRRVTEDRLLAVVGPPEVGKSSLVAAGLLPLLDDSWSIARLRPGKDPAANLLAALGQSGVFESSLPESPRALLEAGADTVASRASARLLVVVDQFDEMLRYQHCRRLSGAARNDDAFIAMLAGFARTDAGPVHLLLTTRNTFAKRCRKELPLLSAAFDPGFRVEPLSKDQLGRTILEPVGGDASPGLVRELSNLYDPDLTPPQLPVFQHALMRAWDRAQEAGDSRLEAIHLREIAGPDESAETEGDLWLASDPGRALRIHAEEVYAGCDSREQAFVGRMFRTVTALVAGGWARRSASVGRLAQLWKVDVDLAERVAERFQAPGAAFLRPASAPVGPETVVDTHYESFVWTLGEVWDHRETPLLSAALAERAAPAGQALGRLAKWALAALLPFALAGALANRAADTLPASIPADSRECCPPGDPTFVPVPTDELRLTERDIQRLQIALDVHLTGEHVRGMPEAPDTGSDDIHLTERDLDRIEERVVRLLGEVHMTQAHLEATQAQIEEAHGRGPAGGAVGDVHLTVADLALIRREIERHRPPPVPPAAAPSPTLQFSELASVRAGFVYALDRRAPLVLRELGLELSLEACPESRLALRVKQLETGETLYRTPEASCFDPSLRERPRERAWDEEEGSDAPDNLDTCRAAHFPGPDPPGYHYAVGVNHDARGDYVIVRRCVRECEPRPEDTGC